MAESEAKAAGQKCSPEVVFQGGRPKMLARSGFLHVENIFG
jgi:hypothetical protein